MDRCPNCDAPVRSNAKFCTSCGFRLPNPASPSQPSAQPVVQPEPVVRSEDWRSPFSTTSHYEDNQSWTARVPPPAPEPVAPPPLSVDPAATAVDAAPTFAGWPNFSTSTILAGETDATDATASANAPSADDASLISEMVIEPTPAEVIAPNDASLDDTQPIEQNAAARGESAVEVEDLNDPETVSELDAPHATTEPEVGENPVETPAEPVAATVGGVASDLVHRALSLVDELRSLIPSLRPVSSGSPDIAGARGILSESGAAQPDADSLSSLRDAIQTATQRPRDIDVMLDLVARAGAIQDLLDERDRFASAITRAVSELSENADESGE